MGSIISAINDVIAEHGSWEAYEQKRRETPVVACVGLPVVWKGHRCKIEEVCENSFIIARFTSPGTQGDYIGSTCNNFTTPLGAPVIHPKMAREAYS